MTLVTRFFIGAVITGGALVFAASAPVEYAQPGLTAALLTTMLAVSLLKLRLPLGLGQATMSMAYVVDFTALVTLGVDVAMLIAAVGVLTQCTVNVRQAQPWFRAAFSVAAVVLSLQGAGWIWSALGMGLAPLAVAAAVYFAINTGLVAIAVGLSNGVSVGSFWQRNFARTLPSYLLAAGVASTLQLFDQPYGVVAIAVTAMIVGHLVYASWFRRLARQASY